MSVLPVANGALLGLLTVAGLALVWWPEPTGQPSLVARMRRTLLVVLLLSAALRPGLPGGAMVRTNPSDLNVVFVVDTTTSCVAEDHGSGTRLAGMKSDIAAIAGQLAGARFALISFDRSAVLRMPLTTDGAAVASAAETLLPETSSWSQGSSVTVAGPLLSQVLERAATAHPERPRVVFYLGDGEHTAATPPQAMGVDPALISAGGAVLGYGTAAGGRMHRTGVVGATSPDWVLDPSTGEPARSVIDEARLRDIAGQLGLGYVHRGSGEGVDGVLDLVRRDAAHQVAVAEDGPLSATRAESYWALLLLAMALVAWEAGVALQRLWALRRPGPAGARTTPATNAPAGAPTDAGRRAAEVAR